MVSSEGSSHQNCMALFAHSTFTLRSQNTIYTRYNWLSNHQRNEECSPQQDGHFKLYRGGDPISHNLSNEPFCKRTVKVLCTEKAIKILPGFQIWQSPLNLIMRDMPPIKLGPGSSHTLLLWFNNCIWKCSKTHFSQMSITTYRYLSFK